MAILGSWRLYPGGGGEKGTCVRTMICMRSPDFSPQSQCTRDGGLGDKVTALLASLVPGFISGVSVMQSSTVTYMVGGRYMLQKPMNRSLASSEAS